MIFLEANLFSASCIGQYAILSTLPHHSKRKKLID
jgi:hypothetical protein